MGVVIISQLAPKKTTKNGFTIVELLIVIVIVAILAAISIISYNGVQNRAAETILQSDLKHAVTELEVDRAMSGSYATPDLPSTVKASNGTTFTYASDGIAYCLAATSSRSGAAVYHISSGGAMSQGTCSGQGDGDESGIVGTILGQWDSGALPTTIGGGVSSVSNGGWDGRPAIQFVQPSGNVSQVRFSFSAVTTLAMRAYVQTPTTWGSSASTIMNGRPNATNVSGRVVIGGTGSPGQVRLGNPSGAVIAQSSPNLLNLGQWYRFELQLHQSVNQARAAVFALGSDTPLWDSGWRTDSYYASSDRAEFGPAATSPTLGQIRMTNLIVTDNVDTWIGRATGDS